MRQLNIITKGILGIVISTSVQAQENDTTPEKKKSLFEVIEVTAQKRVESVTKVPMGITALSGDDLESLGMKDTRDIAALVPGFTMARSSSNTPIYTLRGVGFNTPNLSSTSPVGVYFDEVSYAYPYMTQGLSLDIERVEVLKGPQGTLYGRNTTGGLINYASKLPTDYFEASVKGNVGNYGSYGTELMVSGPLSDTVNARAVYRTEQRTKGWQNSVSRDETLGEADRSAARVIFEYLPNDNTDVQLTVNYWEDKSDTQAGQAIGYSPEVFTSGAEAQAKAIFGGLFPADFTGQQIAEAMYVQPGLKESILTDPSAKDADWVSSAQPVGAWPGTSFIHERPELGIDSNMLSLALRVDHTFDNDITFTSLTSYSDLDKDDVNDRSGTQYELVVFNDLGSIKSFSQEFRIAGSTDKMNYIAGIFYSKDELEDRSKIWGGQTSILNRLRILVPAGAKAAGLTDPAALAEIAGGFRNWENYSESESETFAIFGQADYEFADDWKVTFGARYTQDKADFAGCSRDIEGDGNIHQLWNPAFSTNYTSGDCITFKDDFSAGVGPEGAQKHLDENNLALRFSLDWQASDDVLYYTSISRGFKSGAFPSLSGNVESQYSPVTQEEVLAYELGTKVQVTEEIFVNAAAYYYDYTDKQVFGEVLDPVFNSLTRLINVPESTVKGVEADITWSPSYYTTIRLTGSYLNTNIDEYVGYNRFAVETDFAGSEFEYSPEFQFNGLFAQGFQLGESVEGWFTVDWSYSAEQQADFEGLEEFHIDSHHIFGARLSLNEIDAKWNIALFVRNLTDEYYWSSVQVQTDTIFRYAGMPRTYGMEFTWNFE